MPNRAVLSWALYDFANTIFYGVVVTLYLPGYVLGLTGGEHTPYSLALFPPMILSALLGPVFGEIADRTGRARVYVFRWTLLCCACSALLAVPRSAVLVLVVYACAQFAYQSALSLYNAMLPAVAKDADMGRVSGLGVGLGYLGLVFAFPVAAGVVKLADGDVRPAFVVAGALTLLFTLPLYRFCPDPPPQGGMGGGVWKAIATHFGASLALVKRAAADRTLRWFFLGNFLCSDALNAIYYWLAPYLSSPQSLDAGEYKVMVLIGINVAAVPAALWLGKIADSRAAKPVMLFGTLSLLLAAAIPQAFVELHERGACSRGTMQVAGCAALVVFGALGVGGVLGAARKWIYRLVPKAEIGAWYGVYGLFSKVSLVSQLAFSLLADASGGRYRWSIAAVGIVLVLALLALSKVPRDSAGANP